MSIITENHQERTSNPSSSETNNQSVTNKVANPEVKPRKDRRSFTATYKLKLLDELDRCLKPGEIGSVLRREGLYSSQISDWRRQRTEGLLSALNKARGRKKIAPDQSEKVSSLEKEIAELKNKLEQAEAIIDVQKKVSEIFGISHRAAERNEKSS